MRTIHGLLFSLSWILASTVALAQSNPVPFVDQPLVPMSAAPGGSGFTLTVNGTGFVSSSVVNWNGTPLPTTFVSKAQLTAMVAASDIATPQTASVTVSNPAPGGGISNVDFFQVANPVSTVVLSTPSNTGGTGYAVVTADFNRDGKLDLALAYTNAQQDKFVYILLGNGNGTFQSPVAYPISFSPSAAGFPMATGDFNGDGKLDLVAGQSVLLGNGDGTFQPAISLPTQYVPSDEDQFVAADFNGDGKLDLVALEQSAGDLLVMLGNGDGTFTALTPISVTEDCPALLCTADSLVAADFNGDGELDLVVDYDATSPGHSEGLFAVYLGNGDGTFQTPVLTNAVASGGVVALSAIAAADFNGDGKQDVASAISIYNPALMGEPGYIVALVGAVSLGEGNGTFNFNANGFTLGANVYAPALTGDFNADGKLDVATGINIALGNGTGMFQTPPIAVSSVTIDYVTEIIAAVGDFNGDGKLDFAFIDHNTNVLVALQAVGGVVESTPSSLDFATPLLVGATSSPQLMTLTNAGNATLKITGITISGTNASDFAQTNTCGSTLSINASCQVHVTFIPTGGGIRTANVAITDNGLGSPQNLALTGTSQDFSLAVSSAKTVTVTPGQEAADYALTLAPLYGFGQTVQLGCSGGPPQSTCTVTPSSVKLAGTGSATAKVVVVTTVGSASLAHPAGFPPASSRLALWLALPGLSGVVLLGSPGGRARKRYLRWLHGLAFCSLFFLAFSWTGCGSSGTGGTPPGTYSLTVTGTFTSGSNLLKHAVSLTLTVQ
jgi:FG-GAP-like repeat